MKTFLILFFSCIIFSANASADISLLRRLLVESPTNEQKANLFYKQTKGVTKKDIPLLMGFKAMSEFMLCNYGLNIFSKLNHFNTGKKWLEEAIEKEKNNAELIYFRFTVQTNAPALLAYSSKTKEDKQFLINYLKDNFSNVNKDVALYKQIKNYLLQCSACNKSEKESIKNL